MTCDNKALYDLRIDQIKVTNFAKTQGRMWKV